MNHESTRAAGPDTNGFAIASLVLGIVWAMGLGSILALVFGYIAKGQIVGSHRAEGGYGLAIAGIVLGWVGAGVALASVAMMALGLWTMPMMPMGR